jgi:alanine racemase
MQMTLVEIPLHSQVKIGDEVEVPVRKTLAIRSINRVYTKSAKPSTIEDGKRILYGQEDN